MFQLWKAWTRYLSSSHTYIRHNAYRTLLFFLEGTVTNPAIWWFFTRPVFPYLCPRATVTLSWIAEYMPNFVAIFHKYISFFRLGSSFKQTRRLLPPADNLLMNSLLSLSQITLVDRKILVSEWICLSNSVITLIGKRPKNRLQF